MKRHQSSHRAVWLRKIAARDKQDARELIARQSGYTRKTSQPLRFMGTEPADGILSVLTLHKEGGGLGAPRDVQFLEHVGEIVLDGLITEPHRGCNFFVGQTFCHQGQDTLFLRGKRPFSHRAGLSRLGFDPT